MKIWRLWTGELVESEHASGGEVPAEEQANIFMHTTSRYYFPATSDRVERVTCKKVNERIQRETEERLAHAALGGPSAINQRLEELDREWDIERTLEANASVAVLTSLTLGFLKDSRWFAVSFAVPTFLLLHALEGWRPPLPILRHLGVRTQTEINLERTALRLLRGHFQATADPHAAIHQVEEVKEDGPRIISGT